MKILQIGQVDQGGGAAAVAWSIKKHLDEKNIANYLSVGHKSSDDSSVFEVPKTASNKLASFLRGSDNITWPDDHFFDQNYYRQADIVHCHNLHGRYFDLGVMPRISREKKLVWTFHDEWPVTPGSASVLGGTKTDENGFYETPSIEHIFQCLFFGYTFSREKTYIAARELAKKIVYREKALTALKKSIYDSTDMTIVVPSEWLRLRLARSVLKNKKIVVIPNGIDNKAVMTRTKKESRSLLDLPEVGKILLFVADRGSNAFYKGWNYALPGIAQMKDRSDVTFVCVGNDIKEKQRVCNVVYESNLNQDALKEYYNAADILLYPSLADNFPLTILEAMSARLPVLAFDTGGINEVIKEGENGWLVPRANHLMLAAKLQQVTQLENDNLERMGQKAKELIERYYTAEIMANRYNKLYDSMLD